jgi:hypothetical protein
VEPARNSLPPAETLVAATFFLMTRHAAIRCPLVGRVIAQQLQYLADHPSDTLTPQLRAVCAKLSAHWASDAAEMERTRTRSSTGNGRGSNLLH